MIKEDVYSKKTKTKNDWIEICVRYYGTENKGMSQLDYAKKYNLNYKAFNTAMNRYKADIIKNINARLSKTGGSPIGVGEQLRKPMSIADQFENSVTSNNKILSTKKSVKWFTETLRKVLGKLDKRVSFNGMVSGKLYTYAYDPLTKDTLPYWDQFPLIIFLERDFGKTTNRPYFRAINLHFLSPYERVNLMKELLSNKATTSNLMKNTRLNVSWEDFKYHPKNQMIIKNYLPTHIRSTIREIPPSEWLNIIKMPLQKFTNDDFNSSSDELNL